MKNESSEETEFLVKVTGNIRGESTLKTRFLTLLQWSQE